MLRRASHTLVPTLHAFLCYLCALCLPCGEVVVPLLVETARYAPRRLLERVRGEV